MPETGSWKLSSQEGQAYFPATGAGAARMARRAESASAMAGSISRESRRDGLVDVEHAPVDGLLPEEVGELLEDVRADHGVGSFFSAMSFRSATLSAASSSFTRSWFTSATMISPTSSFTTP